MGQTPEAANTDSARVVLVPVPYDATTSYHAGARFGPQAILAASLQLEFHDLELGRAPVDCGVAVVDPLEPDLSSPAAMVDGVQRVCAHWQQRDKLVVTLGGEHTVAVGAARAAAEKHGSLSFLQIDAHLDLRDTYQNTSYSHACTARRLWELGEVVAVGIRDGSAAEQRWAKKKNAAIFFARDIAAGHDDTWMDEVVAQLGPQVYVTFDVDGLDPAVMPATGTPVPGGLGYWQTLRLLRRVARKRQVVAWDICELAPMEGQPGAALTAAKILYKMIGYFTSAAQR
jgi:agmatinase